MPTRMIPMSCWLSIVALAQSSCQHLRTEGYETFLNLEGGILWLEWECQNRIGRVGYYVPDTVDAWWEYAMDEETPAATHPPF